MATAASEAGFAALQADRAVHDVNITSQLSVEYAEMVAAMRDTFNSGRTRDIAWRRRQLEGLMRGIQENTEAIRVAVNADLGGPAVRAILDMGPIINHCEYALENLTAWTTPKVCKNDLPIDFQSTYQIRPEPKGVILNIAPWNAPMLMCFLPLIPALAAGNCMVIKPSELAPHAAEVVKMIATTYLDNDCVKIVQGAVAETTALLDQRWDHMFYTGNGIVGRIVMQAAARNLTPLTLELGGKSPVIVDKTANMDTVVNRVFTGKTTNQGQICVSPDYVLIDKSREKEFLDRFAKQVASSNFGAGSKSNPNWGKVINSRHAERLQRLIDTSGGVAVCGGSEDVDVQAQHVPVTVLTGVDLDAPIMHEEIFGPLLPVIPMEDINESIDFVNSKERPLALYVFSQDKAFQEKVLSHCPSGGACVNTAVEQLMNKEVAFGGTGASGFGRYFGKHGFEEFSHHRTVLFKTGSAPMLPHIEQQPDWMYDVALKAMVTGFLKPETKRKVKFVGGTALALGAAVALRSRL